MCDRWAPSRASSYQAPTVTTFSASAATATSVASAVRRGFENGSLPFLRCGRFQLRDSVECRNRQRIADVTRTDDEQNPEPLGQVIEQPPPRTHCTGKRSILVAERKIDNEDVGRRCFAVAVAFLHSRNGAIGSCRSADDPGVFFRSLRCRGIEHGSKIDRTLQRRFAKIAVAVKDQRRHFRAVTTFRDDADVADVVGIVEYDATVQQAMPLHRCTVEQCRDRWGPPRPPLARRVRRRPAHRPPSETWRSTAIVPTSLHHRWPVLLPLVEPDDASQLLADRLARPRRRSPGSTLGGGSRRRRPGQLLRNEK